MFNPGEIKGFCPKSCYIRPSSNLLMNVMQYPGLDLLYGTVPWVPISDGKIFFGLHLYLAGRCFENSQSAMAPRKCESGPGTTWLVGVTIYCIPFCSNNSPPPRQFLRTKYFKKKKLARGKFLLNKSLNIN